MSFSAEWLALREPADHRARSAALLDGALAAIADRTAPRIVDLGCGAGSNMRAMAGRLPADARLRLVDRDPALLTRAAETLPGLAPDLVEADLAMALEPQVADADLITGAALLDLVSASWLERLVETAPPRAIFHFALTYDGRESRDPATRADRVVHAAFLRHQQRDKGFGPALGPGAAQHLAAALAARGYAIRSADSAWRLTAEQDGALIEALDAGVADAAEEEGADATLWRAARRTRALVGHIDLLALPPA